VDNTSQLNPQLLNCLLKSLTKDSPTDLNSESESDSYVMTDGQSASLSWKKAPIWGLRPEFYYCQTVAGLLKWGALSDERTGLSFTVATDPDLNSSQSQSHIATDGQSVSKSWRRAPSGAHGQILITL
jgi:hypothetical protein